MMQSTGYPSRPQLDKAALRNMIEVVQNVSQEWQVLRDISQAAYFGG